MIEKERIKIKFSERIKKFNPAMKNNFKEIEIMSFDDKKKAEHYFISQFGSGSLKEIKMLVVKK